MAYNYDALYRKQPNALGAPTPAFVTFFSDIDVANLRVLDIGCGQGRDAVFIAKSGHCVVGVDMSAAGIEAVNDTAARDGLDITGVVEDITKFTPEGMFDVLLIDRTLHMLGEDDRHAVLAKLLKHLRPLGYLLIADEASNISGFKRVIAHLNWRMIKDKGGYLFAQMIA